MIVGGCFEFNSYLPLSFTNLKEILMKIIFLFATVLLLQSGVALAGSPCEDEAIDHLTVLGIDAELVNVTKSKTNSNSKLISNYRHWHRTPLCDHGYVVVKTTASCQVFETYTQNSCKIEGLRSYLSWLKE